VDIDDDNRPSFVDIDDDNRPSFVGKLDMIVLDMALVLELDMVVVLELIKIRIIINEYNF
jgi:hypothetical protein